MTDYEFEGYEMTIILVVCYTLGFFTACILYSLLR